MEGNAATPLTPFPQLAILKSNAKQPRLYTLGEFLEKEERSEERHEYLNGIIKKLPMATGNHNIIVANMTMEMGFAFKSTQKKYIIMSSQQLVYLPELNFSRYPDAVVVTEKPIYYDEGDLLLTNPLLIIEVLSKSTRKYDRTEKFQEYKTLPSFKEYILIDPEKYNVEIRYQEETNLWRDTQYKNLEEKIVLKSVGVSIPMEDIYQNVQFK